MRIPLLLLSCLCTLGQKSAAQTTVSLTDDLFLPSNASIVVQAGNYALQDSAADGLLRIEGQKNIVVDGSNVNVDGQNFSGCLLRITDADSIIIRNFNDVRGFFYAVQVERSKHVRIENCNFNYNKVDSSGWISIWTDYDQALGGGVLFKDCADVTVRNCHMQYQNDGVALYTSKRADIHDNTFSWNTSYGIRMYFTDSSYIHDNIAAQINRPYTDPSDCAALLMLVSNHNRVEHNDLSYSGDGVFLGQYQYSEIPNNNYFAYNECSFSPHNAIEATFADGNIYKHNLCNNSHYGMWLGYSFNSQIDSNDISGNQYAGIAIDRGHHNRIQNNRIRNNPTGIELWEGSPIAGYATQNSQYYTINQNTIEGNTTGISASTSERSLIRNNVFLYNRTALYLELNAILDSINGNFFHGTTVFHIDNHAPQSVNARNNLFPGADSSILARKINDHSDNPTYGTVYWQPAVLGQTAIQTNPQTDLAEPPAHWNVYAEACWGYGLPEATTVQWDSTLKKSGLASVHLHTGNGWYMVLGYHPGADSTSRWVLSDADTLKMWLRTIRQIPYGFQFFHVRLGDDHGGWFEYTAPVALLNNAHLNWKAYSFPLAGNSTWVRTAYNNVSLADINYVEIWADTWDFGFDLWVDGLRFGYAATGVSDTPQWLPDAVLAPNPAQTQTELRFRLEQAETLHVRVFDLQGKLVRSEAPVACPAGNNRLPIPLSDLVPGLYICQIGAARGVRNFRLAVARE